MADEIPILAKKVEADQPANPQTRAAYVKPKARLSTQSSRFETVHKAKPHLSSAPRS